MSGPSTGRRGRRWPEPGQEVSEDEAALAPLDRRAMDLVLPDMEMPGLDEVETCRRIRERSDIPVIFLTSRNRPADIAAGLEAGAGIRRPSESPPAALNC